MYSMRSVRHDVLIAMSGRAQRILDQLLENARLASVNQIAICQDTAWSLCLSSKVRMRLFSRLLPGGRHAERRDQ
jgi:tartrate dehydratase alpha subunit/fumarate hydratase class I-like protein